MTPSLLRDQVKRWSIWPVVTYDLLATVGAAVLAAGHAGLEALSWISAALTTAALPAQLVSFLGLRKGRTSRNLTVMTAIASAAATTAVVTSVLTKTGWPALVAILGLLSTQYYARWYSRLERQQQAILGVGARLPHFEVIDADGTPVKSESFIGRPTAFIFIRGNWCPLCVAQVRELAAEYESLAARGIDVALVSPQPLEETRKLAQRFGVNFRYLTDPAAAAAASLGIRHDGGVPPGVTQLGYEPDTVFPTVIVIDASGTVVFSDQTDDYRVRPEPALFITALDAAQR